MVAGKVHPGEQAWQTAVRELWEETGLPPASLFSLPSLNRFYEWQSDRVMLIPAFVAEVHEDPTLNGEHDAFEWIRASDAVDRLDWPEQRRLLTMANEMVVSGRIPESLRIPLR